MAMFIQDNFTGGIAEGSKRGYKGAYQDGIGLDFRTDPDNLKVLPRLVKISGSTVTGLPKWGVEYLGKKYVYDSAGKIYEISALDAVSLLHTVSNSAGQGIGVFNEELWYASSNKIGKTTDLDGTPSFTDDYFTTPQYEAPDYYTLTATNTYQLQTAISETSTHRLPFTTTADTVIGLTVTVVARGTGNWTFTLHDSSNNSLGAVTVANADLPASTSLVRITLPSVVQLTVGQTYHWHITTSTGTSTIRANTSNDCTTAEASVHQYLNNIDMDQSSEPAPATNITLADSYAALTTISETAVNMRSFTPEYTSIGGIALLINNHGTSADWTLTLHDQFNTTLGTATLTNANVRKRGTWTTFRFTDAVEVIPGVEYHFHITVSNTTGTPGVLSGTTSDLSDAYYRTYTPVLDSDDDYHPMATFLNKLLVGNGNHLLTIDDSEVLEIEALTFPRGESVRAIETIGDYAAIATWRGHDIESFGSSRIYLWDGTSPTFNAFIDIDGQTNAMKNDSNKLVIIHGTQCTISYYTGGVTKMRRLKNVQNNITTEVLPGAMAIYEGLLHFGLTNSSSSDIATCVYSYGRKDKDYPYALSKDYPISSGATDNSVEIGMILAIGAGQFYVGWRDGADAGIDKIDLTKQQQTASFTTMRFDDGNPNQQKQLTAVSLRFDPLLYNTVPNPDQYEKITIKYRFDKKTAWNTLGTVDPLNVTEDQDILYKSFPQPEDTRWFEIEWQVVMESNADTNAEGIILQMQFDRLPEFQIGTAI